MGHVDAFRRLLEQIDNRRTSQTKRVCFDGVLHARLRSVEEDDDFNLVTESSLSNAPPAGQVEEVEFAREREELGQKPIAEKRAIRIGQERIVALESDGGQALRGGQRDRRRLRILAERPEYDLRGVIEQQFVQSCDGLLVAVQIAPQRVQR